MYLFLGAISLTLDMERKGNVGCLGFLVDGLCKAESRLRLERDSDKGIDRLH